MKSLYGVATIVSFLIRQFVLPNPFECFGEIAILINWIAEPILQVVTYLLVGLVYRKGDMPAMGSVLFLITYASIVEVFTDLSVWAGIRRVIDRVNANAVAA